MSFREVPIYVEVFESLCVTNALDMNEASIVKKYKSLYLEWLKYCDMPNEIDKSRELISEMDKLILTAPIQSMLWKKRQKAEELLRNTLGEYGKDWI